MIPVPASTARGWPSTRGHAHADGHATRQRKTRARWCGHAAPPGHCPRPLAAANARASVPARVGAGVGALVGREGEGTVERGRAWASSSIGALRLAWA